MSRRPWRSRVWLAGLFDAVAGGVIGVLVYAGFDDGIGVTESIVGIFNLALAIAVNFGVIADGETKTTPVEDPLGVDLLPLLPFRKLDELTEAVKTGNTDKALKLLGSEVPH